MKYRCKNCGQVYLIKTDYCDCGNNQFDTIYEEADLKNKTDNENYQKYQELYKRWKNNINTVEFKDN